MKHKTLSSFAMALAIPLALAATQAPAGGKAFVWTHDDPELEWSACADWLPDGCKLTVLQGDPAEPNADVLFRIPANSKLANHWHTSAERMVLIAGEFHIDFEGQDPVVMKPGTYAYGPAKLNHSAECKDAGDCYLFVAFEEPVDAVPVD